MLTAENQVIAIRKPSSVMAIIRRILLRRAMRQLDSLDDHVLRDIGLTRCDLARVLQQAR
jgi:uncharacterized protein YjiS (DUF1127 family)